MSAVFLEGSDVDLIIAALLPGERCGGADDLLEGSRPAGGDTSQLLSATGATAREARPAVPAILAAAHTECSLQVRERSGSADILADGERSRHGDLDRHRLREIGALVKARARTVLVTAERNSKERQDTHTTKKRAETESEQAGGKGNSARQLRSLVRALRYGGSS